MFLVFAKIPKNDQNQGYFKGAVMGRRTDANRWFWSCIIRFFTRKNMCLAFMYYPQLSANNTETKVDLSYQKITKNWTITPGLWLFLKNKINELIFFIRCTCRDRMLLFKNFRPCLKTSAHILIIHLMLVHWSWIVDKFANDSSLKKWLKAVKYLVIEQYIIFQGEAVSYFSKASRRIFIMMI